MSISRFLKSFALMLVIPLLTHAAAPKDEQLRLSHQANTNHYLSNTKELSKMPGDPVKFEKFILKTAESLAPSDKDAINSKAKTKLDVEPDAERPSDKIVLSGQANLSIPAQPLFSSSNRRLTLIDKTYLDAYTILQENNSCSRFFGGPRIATGVLNSLHPRLKKTSLAESPAGIGMFGPITTVTDFGTGVKYRLFEKALVNQDGPFYQSVNYQSQGYFHKIGHFSANTREARVSMLLHELGHLLQGPDGRWLLPDDGGDDALSAANTMTIMNKCSAQIKSLSLQPADTPRLEASTQTESKPLPAINR
ncbi:MAG TPA: hypothetical protein VGO91_17585 [Pyrinomonadaceae bacterium]|jgi:hypothetical protein|nr:hypothetical protein [Pyrinomonadaceae bacterium]